MESVVQDYEKSLMEDLLAPKADTLLLEDALQAIKEESFVWQGVNTLLQKENLEKTFVVSKIKCQKVNGRLYLIVQLSKQRYFVIDIAGEKCLQKEEISSLFPASFFIKEMGEDVAFDSMNCYHFLVAKKETIYSLISTYISHEDVFADVDPIVSISKNEAGTATVVIDPHTLHSTLIMEDTEKKSILAFAIDKDGNLLFWFSPEVVLQFFLTKTVQDCQPFKEMIENIRKIRLPKEVLSARRQERLELQRLSFENKDIK